MKTNNTTATNNQTINSNQQIIDAMRSMQNGEFPIGSNSVIQNANQMLSQIKDPKEAFYAAARQRGIDPDAAVRQLQQMFK